MLLSLSVEILTEITCQSDLDPADLAHLATLHSALYHIAIPHLYMNDLRHGGSHCMFWAAKNGRLQTLIKALEHGADPNVVGPDEADSEAMLDVFADVGNPDNDDNLGESLFKEVYGTPLHSAASFGHDDIVAALLDAGADVHAPSRGICKCRFHCLRGSRDSLEDRQLLDGDFPLPNWLPLHHAVCHGRVSTANLLLDRGASLQMCYEPRSLELALKLPSLVHCAAANGLESLVQRALEIDAGTPLRGEDDLDSPLHYACESWDSDGVIKHLVAAGHDLNLECGRFQLRTPLFRACEVGNYATALNLLRAGADPRRGEYDDSFFSNDPLPLIHRAVLPPPWPPIVNIPKPLAGREVEQLAFIWALVKDYGFDVDEPARLAETDMFCYMSEPDELAKLRLTPLQFALRDEKSLDEGDFRPISTAVVRFLLKLGADPNRPDYLRRIPLSMLVSHCFELVKSNLEIPTVAPVIPDD
ncbi:uncharacterized protein PG986_014269 [Apiospora aurea]|uniref:Ankyrin repeat protein n=1 Tax=Apiospora aurea TaxID=335848 RepID=A0ABR1PSI7_9PEZI